MMRRWIYPVLVLCDSIDLGDVYACDESVWPVQTVLAPFVDDAVWLICRRRDAMGGAAVAFPVFTKVFQIPSADARTFGLMIQSFGMTMASITILLRRTPLMPRVLLWSCVGGAIGVTLGTF